MILLKQKKYLYYITCNIYFYRVATCKLYKLYTNYERLHCLGNVSHKFKRKGDALSSHSKLFCRPKSCTTYCT